MKIFWTTLIIYLVIMNIAAMSMTIIDKRRAMQKHYYNRISERALLFHCSIWRCTIDVSYNAEYST